MLAVFWQKSFHFLDDVVGLERLGDVIVGFGNFEPGFVKIIKIAFQQNHRDVGVRFLDPSAQFVAIEARHLGVGQHDVGLKRIQQLKSGLAIFDALDLYVFLFKGHQDDFLYAGAVVSDQNF